ncbi:DUF418 domain-containing protein [Allosphingosinicella sp.]|uniref:DUF418 domain-containing protein n=1 Tax=Allosphingosinicella sp. TaxID=2823234 RepID=UPI0037831FE4
MSFASDTSEDDWDSAPAAPARIATLDIVRGIAVMGILAMNIVAFSMPFQAYMNPTAYGLHSQADLGSWVFSFIFIDGKMRGLFSFLFGASTLLVIQQARAAGESPAKIHSARMFWLLIFGLIHFYFIWFGDILTMYALTGLLLFFFRNLKVKSLIIWGVALLLVQCTIMAGGAWQVHQFAAAVAAGHADPDVVTAWQGFEQAFGRINGQDLAQTMQLFLGSWDGLVHQRLVVQGLEPFTGIKFFIAETLAYMLFGMAALKSGFFRGEWAVARYRKWALIGFAIAIPAYAVLAWLLIRADFSVPDVFTYSLAATTPFRPFMIVAIAATIVLLTRKGGWLVDRIAAAGRAAFTNYLGTSLLMTTFFYGYGLGWYGHLSRIQLWLPVVAVWVIMLLWSKPWLDRYRYGPFEWLWRSLARARFQPMRKRQAPSSASSADS